MISGNYEKFNQPVRSISATVRAINNSPTLANATGNPLTITDGLANSAITATLTSKNLLAYPYTFTGRVMNNVDIVVNADGTLTISGVPSKATSFVLTTQELESGQYTYKGCVNAVYASNNMCYSFVRVGESYYYDRGLGTTFTLTEKATATVGVIIGANYDGAEIALKPQIEAGAIATAYAPYTTDFSGVEVVACGKNLANPAQLIKDSYQTTLDGDIFTSTTTNGTVYVNNDWTHKAQYHPPGTYTASVIPVSENVKLSILIYNRAGGVICNHVAMESRGFSKTFTANEDFRFAIGGGDSSMHGTHSYKLQLETGSVATEYEPYSGITATADSSGIIEGITLKSGVTNIYTLGNVNISAEYSVMGEEPIDIKHTDNLKELVIDRTGASKFFGFGVSHKATIKLLDKERVYNFNKETYYQLHFDGLCIFPNMYYTESARDENTNELTITAFDALQGATKHTVAELGLKGNYSIADFTAACAALLGLAGVSTEYTSAFSTQYPEGANFDGTETIRAALDAVAEATQTIYFIDRFNKLVFKRLAATDAVFTIGKESYFKLDSKENIAISGVCSATELADDVFEKNNNPGNIMQYVRNNPFWELREDIGELVTQAAQAMEGVSATAFSCNWRGNYLLEITDKIEVITKDNQKITSYLLNDTMRYDGGFSQVTQWAYTAEEATAANPATLGEKLKQTFARVDKQAQDIQLVAKEASATKEQVAALQVTTSEINASISTVETTTNEALDNIRGDVTTLTSKVNATMTSEQVRLEIQNELNNGVSKVETNTGFTFDDTGLTVSKSNSEMKTTITEDGMKVYKNDAEMLTANNAGVYAENLHATTYLIIGKNSRLEDMGNDRTACFWIGG